MRGQRGQSMVEFLLALASFGLLLLGLFQAILFYRAKATIDYAALEAARAGALHGAAKADMATGFARGVTPLFATATASPDPTHTLEAFVKAKLQAPLHSKIEVISPTAAAFNDFKEAQWDGRQAIPNDSLNFRPTTVKASGMSVQDANILKIRVTYNYPLIVPVIDRLVSATLLQGPDPVYTTIEGHTVYSIPIVATAEVRMQSPIYDAGNLAK